jgi:hypothetical protein
MQLKRTITYILFLLFSFTVVNGVLPATLATAQGQDLAIIASPANNAVVRDAVQITGSADYPSFQFYIVELSPEPITGNQWQIVGVIHEQPVLNGVLETWDTTRVPDGSYTLRLRVVRLDGNYSEAFSQQVVVSNAQPIPTDTPTPAPESAEPTRPPTVTPTALPPTPTIVIEQPIVDTPTPRAIATTPPLQDPEAEDASLIPTVSGFSFSPLRDACMYGGGLMLVIFLLFGFLSALRQIVVGIINRRRGI